MIPKWQMAALFAALGLLLVAAFSTSPYGHALLTGQCRKEPQPRECQRIWIRGGVTRGVH